MEKPSTVLAAEFSTDETEKDLIGAGYFRLSEADKEVIVGKAEALAFAQEERTEKGEV
jgi:hypothetical protein